GRASRSQNERRPRVFIEVEQPIGKFIEREPHVAEALGQSFKHIIELAPAGDLVPGNELIIGPADLLIKLEVRSAPIATALRVLMKNAADEERIISNVCAKQKHLLG